MEHTFFTQERASPALFEMNRAEVETLSRLLSKVIATTSDQTECAVTPDRVQKVARAEAYYRFRRKRENVAEELFGKDLFVDPNWDMLLDLYIHTVRGIPVRITSACLASYSPATTALRHIGKLERRGIVKKMPHEKDGRVLQLKLTDKGLAMMDDIAELLPFRQV